MTDTLFRPFDIKKWFVLGFTAFLADLGSTGGGSSFNSSFDDVDFDNFGEGPQQAWEALAAHSFLFALGAFGCVMLLVVGVVVLWLSSRGKFMFLDNVVHNRALVVDPWKRFRNEGNSLFLFRIAFFLIAAMMFVGLGLLVAATIGFGALNDFDRPSAIAPIIAVAGGLALLVLATLYGAFFLDAFVVPLMHRYNLGTIAAFSRFLEIFRQQAWAFLLCGLMVIVLGVGIVVLALGFGLMTCCFGFLLLALPYVSSVLTLPISVFYRRFTFEFLAQFDSNLLPEEAPEDSPPAAPPVPSAAEASA